VKSMSAERKAAVAEAKEYLAQSARMVAPILRGFWERKRREWAHVPEIVRAAFDAYDVLTSDGKKIRSGLTRLGYDVCRDAEPGNLPPEGVLRAAAGIEILHNAFLIHDDIMDESDLRRSLPTVHRKYADAFRSRFDSEEAALRYGKAVALNFGDKGQALAQELVLDSGFPEPVLLRAVRLMSRVTAETVAGQLLDVADVHLDELTQEQVLLIHEYKTAHYTVMLPLMLGAILAGAEEERLEALERFSIPLGIAFQIRDDILGLFGDERTIGKPVDSDLREGKKTLLFVHAYERANAEERRALLALHGNSTVSMKDLELIRRIVRSTGALSRSEQVAREMVARSEERIPEITQNPYWARLLRGLAEFFIERRY